MPTAVFVHLLPETLCHHDLRDGTVVILDVLRASTVIVQALQSGAEGVIPVADVEIARALADQMENKPVLLGGERNGILIPGFDLDNNPLAYTPKIVTGRVIVFTTTNGTSALDKARTARTLLIGAMINRMAVAKRLASVSGPVHLVCAGTQGFVSNEDVLAAGAIVAALSQLLEIAPTEAWIDDNLELALALYNWSIHSSKQWLDTIKRSRGGRNCLRLGFDEQVEFASQLDISPVVPSYDPAVGQLRIREDSQT